ncbi:MAG: hypothetical protein NC337_02510 [Roseburia sp.]|nr:hypothetical protein [Roseburia sp.]
MSKITKNYQQLAAGIGLGYDEQNNCLYGVRNGYELLIYANDPRYPYLLTISTSARSGSCILGKEENKLFTKSVKPAAALTQKDSLITAVSRNSTNNVDKMCENMNYLLDAMTAFLHERGFEPCCQTCGTASQTVGFAVEKARMHLCPSCAARIKSENEVKIQEKGSRRGNLVGGIVGAFLGSLIGVLCIVIFSQLGYVAAISGVIMAVCTVKGFELLGGRLNKVGIVICCVIMAVMTWFGNRLDWGILIMKESGMSIFDGFQAVPMFRATGRIENSNYLYNMGMTYLFTALGAIPSITSVVKNKKDEHYVSQIGNTAMQNDVNNF